MREWSKWTFAAAVAALAIVAAVRVASTHRVFSGVLDEPVHVVSGHQWLRGEYSRDPSHPPLSRVLFALPLRSLPAPLEEELVEAGEDLLYHGNRYVKNLARARIGNLVLLIAAIVAVAAWARRAFSSGVAILGAAIFSSLPPVLGHAGLATTDLAVTATLPLALLALDRFLAPHPALRATLSPPSRGEGPPPADPSPRASGEKVAEGRMRGAVFLGIAIGLGLLSKFSFLVFFPAAAIVLIALRWRPRIKARQAIIVLATAFLVTWGGYRFHFARADDVFDRASFFIEYGFGPTAQPFARWLSKTPVPAPELLIGVALLNIHNQQGHLAYLLGESRTHGWWYYFPVIFFYKTPIPFLILAAWGMGLLVRARNRMGWQFILVPVAILLVSMTSSINIGIRHILPMYTALSIVAAYAAIEIWKRAGHAFSRGALLALMTWLFAGVALAHPDYMAWFNGAAQPTPSRIAVDSNLDWGQDLLRLERAVRELGIKHLGVTVVNNFRFELHGIQADTVSPFYPQRGWIAVSESTLRWGEATGHYSWLRMYKPVRQIGTSIRLYYIP